MNVAFWPPYFEGKAPHGTAVAYSNPYAYVGSGGGAKTLTCAAGVAFGVSVGGVNACAPCDYNTVASDGVCQLFGGTTKSFIKCEGGGAADTVQSVCQVIRSLPVAKPLHVLILEMSRRVLPRPRSRRPSPRATIHTASFRCRTCATTPAGAAATTALPDTCLTSRTGATARSSRTKTTRPTRAWRAPLLQTTCAPSVSTGSRSNRALVASRYQQRRVLRVRPS